MNRTVPFALGIVVLLFIVFLLYLRYISPVGEFGLL